MRNFTLAEEHSGLADAMRQRARYKVVRMYQRASIRARTIVRGLSLAEAQAWCHDPETSSRTATHSDGGTQASAASTASSAAATPGWSWSQSSSSRVE